MRDWNGLGTWAATLGASDLLGLLGVVLYVGAYFAFQVGLMRGDGYAFPALNLVASLSILASLWAEFNPYATSVELAWAAISILGLTRLYIVRNYIHLTPEQTAVVQVLAPGLSKDLARRLLRLGRFEDAAPGLPLAQEGVPLQDLTLLLTGHARVDRGGQTVATVRAGGLVGEMTYATGAAATASVMVDAPSRLFRLDCTALRAFLARNPEIASRMEMAVTGDLRTKLDRTTAALRSQSGARPG
jgi:CRP-like cAMP-binding protein